MYSELIARHFRHVVSGGNWTTSSLKEHLEDITLEEATTPVYDLNTIARLIYHIHYYIHHVLKVLKGGPLQAHDKYSWDVPALNSDESWEQLKKQLFEDAAEFADLAEQLPDNMLLQDFTDPKYGSYYRNLHGIIEHTHYHLGQIVVIKKILRNPKK